ncbi:methylenetetrahydrofolate reductase [NAD(P)H] [Reinekea forsetii]|jgi:methylenetetrahydrofolate reductase (NADPH)|uniref:Methylenetetrahydrofolate reductase n=1 Tax=Reinekea forsetii TaxID=1336806 RepID=A0A2K8KJK2_9GAMM|nr:methylenetetrahydrofolate reductase [NAD(P)H] [Reinekea forsetii]ATX75237.1 5,10-methylenetetrahydrofolate reductase [Reinekea forsetii]
MNTPVPVSFEFFPPKTDIGYDKLLTAHDELKIAQPEFFSVTYGAGGSTQERTINTVIELNSRGVPAAPHLSCIGSNRATVQALLEQYQAAGINRIVALRGDLPSGMRGTGGDFNHASDLVTFIKAEFADTFSIEVAAYPEMHPQANSFDQDVDHFVAKAKAGADSAITQYFYNINAYKHFVSEVRRRDCDIAIVPGIMPITNFTNLARFSDACGADIPRWMRQALQSCGDDVTRIQRIGLNFVVDLCQELIVAGAPKLHFYSMNQSAPTLAILAQLEGFKA